MTNKDEEPSNPEFVREELCQSRMDNIVTKINGLRTEMKMLLGSSLITIILVLLQFMREFLG